MGAANPLHPPCPYSPGAPAHVHMSCETPCPLLRIGVPASLRDAAVLTPFMLSLPVRAELLQGRPVCHRELACPCSLDHVNPTSPRVRCNAAGPTCPPPRARAAW